MSDAQAAATAAVVASATADERTTEQKRRSVSNPFAFSVEGSALMLALGGQTPVEIGQIVPVPGKGLQIRREGSNLAKGDTAQATLATAAYYAVRNLLSRAASRQLGDGGASSAENAQLTQKVSTLEGQTAVTNALLTGGNVTLAEIAAAGGEQWLGELSAKLPGAMKAKLGALVKRAFEAAAAEQAALDNEGEDDGDE